jgi:WD40 repeat protein
VAFHPTGRFLATGGFDHTVGIWNLEGGLLAQLTGHHEAVKRVAWSADGTTLVSVGRDSQVIVWDLARFVAKRVIEQPAFDLAVTADGKRVFTVGPKTELSVYDPNTGRLLGVAEPPGSEGRQLVGITLSQDDNTIVTTSLAGITHIWDAKKLSVRFRITERVRGVSFAPDGRLAVSSDGGVKLVDPTTGKVSRTIKTAERVGRPAFSRDGRRLFTGSGTNVLVLDSETGKTLTKFPVGILESMAVSPDASLVATGNDDAQVRLWSASSGAPVRGLGSPWGSVTAASFDPTGEHIATAATGWVDVWSARSGEILQRFRAKTSAVGPPAWSPDGALVAAAVGNGTVSVWDVARGAEAGTISVPTRDDWGARFAFSPDARQVAVFDAKRLSVWDRGKRKVVKTISVGIRMVGGVAWSKSVVAVGGAEGVDLIDAVTWKPLRHLDLKPVAAWARVEALSFSADGRTLITASSKFIARWDVDSGRLLDKIEGRTLHAAPVLSPDGGAIAFPNMERGVSVWRNGHASEVLQVGHTIRQIKWSPNGRLLAIASDDSQIRVVDVIRQKLDRTLAGHEARIWSLEWHPGGEVLLGAGHQARLHAIRDGRALTLRARFDRKAGIVHDSGGQFMGAKDAWDLLRLRTGGGLEHAKLVPVDASRENPGLLEELWRR